MHLVEGVEGDKEDRKVVIRLFETSGGGGRAREGGKTLCRGGIKQCKWVDLMSALVLLDCSDNTSQSRFFLAE